MTKHAGKNWERQGADEGEGGQLPSVQHEGERAEQYQYVEGISFVHKLM